MKSVTVVLIAFLVISLFSFVVAQEDSLGEGVRGDLARVRNQVRAEARDVASDTRAQALENLREEYQRRKQELRESYKEKCASEDLTREERIRCGLFNEEYRNKENRVPEVCRRLIQSDVPEERKERCKALIDDSKECREIEDGKEKRECLRKAAGVETNLEDENPEVREDKARRYVSALLDNLRDRVEKRIEQEQIDPDEAVKILDYIDEVNKDVFEGATKREIKQMLDELRKMWRDAMSDVEPVDVDTTDSNDDNMEDVA